MILTAALATPAVAQSPAAWTQPAPPLHVIGPIDYVGSAGLSSYLIRTRAGAILIDGTMRQNAAMIARNVAAMGVPIRDVKLILLTHAHFDHAGGLRDLKRMTGAKLIVGAGDRRAVESGRHVGDNENGIGRFPPVAVDRTVRDGEVVRLGQVALVAHATPGHTAGCTSWSTRVTERGRRLGVLFPCSLTVAGNRLIRNRAHPGIVADYRRSFATLARLRADVVLPAHPEFAGVRERAARGTLVAPELLPRMVTEARSAFEAELAKQTAAAR